MILSDIHRGIKKHRKRLRIGRGLGSGRGKTAGRGHKGQGQLAGWTAHPAFEGGQMPLVRRVPKRGFNNQWALTVKAVNVGNLEKWFDSGAEVTIESLRASGKVKGRFDVLKVLGDGELKKKLKISAHRFSKSALEKIQASGGEAVVLPAKAPVEKGKKRERGAKGKHPAK